MLIFSPGSTVIHIYKWFHSLCSSALKSSPSKKGRVSLTVPKCAGPGAAWSISQLPCERDENIYDLRGAHSFPTLEDDGEHSIEWCTPDRTDVHHCFIYFWDSICNFCSKITGIDKQENQRLFGTDVAHQLFLTFDVKFQSKSPSKFNNLFFFCPYCTKIVSCQSPVSLKGTPVEKWRLVV